MIILIDEKTTKAELLETFIDIPDYVKFVLDVSTGALRLGGVRHVDAETIFLEEGSKQKDLWGGGIDLVTNYVDYGSMINIRPPLNNSKDVLISEIREEINVILKKKLYNLMQLKFEA
jgi:hypothetical protein